MRRQRGRRRWTSPCGAEGAARRTLRTGTPRRLGVAAGHGGGSARGRRLGGRGGRRPPAPLRLTHGRDDDDEQDHDIAFASKGRLPAAAGNSPCPPPPERRGLRAPEPVLSGRVELPTWLSNIFGAEGAGNCFLHNKSLHSVDPPPCQQRSQCKVNLKQLICGQIGVHSEAASISGSPFSQKYHSIRTAESHTEHDPEEHTVHWRRRRRRRRKICELEEGEGWRWGVWTPRGGGGGGGSLKFFLF